MTTVSIGYGSKLYMMDYGESPPVMKKLAEILEVTPPNQLDDLVEATHMESPNRTREYILGLVAPGEASFVMHHVPNSESEALIFANRTRARAVPPEPTQCRLVFPNGVYWEFNALVRGYEPSTPIDDRMTVAVTMQVTGDTTIGQES